MKIKNFSHIIDMAWSDNISFEEIKLMYGVSENEVKRIMKKELKPRSYRIWRERVKKNKRKHSLKYKDYLSSN